MAVPNLLLPDWGNAGAQLGDAFIARTERNKLAQLVPAALTGDPTATSQLTAYNPRLGMQVIDYQRQTAADKTAAAATERERKLQGLKWGAGAIISAQTPEEKARIYTTQVRPHLEGLGFAGLPEQYDPSVDATANSILERFPEMPKAQQPTDDIQEYQFAQKNGFAGSFDQWMARKAQQSGGGSPFFQFLPGADGYLVGNARTGQIAPGMVNGQRAIPGALDPRLQGNLAQAKEEGQGRGEISTDKTKKVVAANSTLGLLDEADKLINTATGSKFGNVIDAGQAVFGKSNEGAEAIARLRVISAGLTANIPRMEGPQSDADRLMYQQAAGDLGNPTVPAAQKAAASATIRQLNQKYISLNSGGAQAPSPPPNSGGATILDWDDLP